MRRFWLVASLLLLVACKPPGPWKVPKARPDTQRHTTAGDVVGGDGRYGNDAWLGVPFAAPPVGSLRWRAPQPVAAWTGVREALAFAARCPQRTVTYGPEVPPTVIGDEDCLYVNVFAPPLAGAPVPTGKDRWPVMVWIHGGGNSMGTAAEYEHGRLAKSEGVLVVSVQYRLGGLGWFRHAALREDAQSPEEASGNFGTLDLIAALEWVRDNAAAFGGDPGNVTIFGESAGGTNVLSLLAAPKAKGLFHRAIAQSAVPINTAPAFAEAFTDDASPGHPSSSSAVLARLWVKAGKASTVEAARAALRSADAASLRAFARGVTPAELVLAYHSTSFGMVDVPAVFGDGALLPADGVAAFARDGWNRVPVMIGSNRDEMKLFLVANPRMVRFDLGGKLPVLVDATLHERVNRAMSDNWKALGVDEPARAMREAGHAAVYAYRFDWDEEPTVFGSDLGKVFGAAHALEIAFVLGHFEFGPLSRLYQGDVASRDALSAAMRRRWADFARTGSPGEGWPAWSVEPGAPNVFVFDTPQGGGMRAEHHLVSQAGVLDGLASADGWAPMDRCYLAHEVLKFATPRPALYETFAGGACAKDFPYAAFPWTAAKR